MAQAIPPCGERLMGEAVYERLEDGKVVERVSSFAIHDWSRDSRFTGVREVIPTTVAPPRSVATSLEVEILPQASKTQKRKHASKRKSFAFLGEGDKRSAAGFDPVAFFKGEKGRFVLRVLESGKPVCQDEPRPILSSD